MKKTPTREPPYYEAFCEEAAGDIFNTDHVIAFTWNPDPKRYPSNSPRSQYKMLLRYILLASYKVFKTFVFLPELTVEGNVHIHGWYVLKDPIKYYKWWLPRCKALGWTRIKDRKIDDGWKKIYITKKINEVVQIIGEDMPIPLTHLNIDAYKDIAAKITRLRKYQTELKRKYDKHKSKSIIDYIKL